MAKYRDKIKYKAKSKLVKYVPDECYKARHSRRLKTAHLYLDRLKNWCVGNDFVVSVYNGGHHIKIKNEKVEVDWWPSSAKCVVNKKWKQAHHTHDVFQLIEILAKHKG